MSGPLLVWVSAHALLLGVCVMRRVLASFGVNT